MTKIVCISDTHGPDGHKGLKIPECDIIIHSGDCSYGGTYEQIYKFAAWFGTLDQCRNKIFVAGNHDWLFQHNQDEAVELMNSFGPVCVLNQESKIVEGFKIYGEPRQPWFFDWAFNVHRQEMSNVWKKVPRDTDILVTHGPPLGHGDITREGSHAGCYWQNELIKEGFLKLVVCGHIHTGHGRYRCKNTKIINASICDGRNKPVNKPIMVKL